MIEKPESTTQDPSPERRTMRRFDMRLPAIVTLPDTSVDELLTETQNVSARGVFL